tara:strand:- start:7251 stop:7817 length:567 start_codon:yes stop_codon:yes gene_type:complete
MLYLALVHHPVLGRKGEVITTSVTNLDIHDIARSCRTYGVSNYFIITPVKKQQVLVQEILDHWNTDLENSYNPDRTSALSFIQLKESLGQMMEDIAKKHDTSPFVVSTGANFKGFDGECSDPKLQELIASEKPVVLLFGTGWGLHQDALELADYKLAPIYGSAEDDYNHLSVRSAVAIYLDRLRNIRA